MGLSLNIKKMKLITSTYRFFDQDIEICSDNKETIELMDSMYKRFNVKAGKKYAQSTRYEVLTSSLPGKKSVIRTNGYCREIEHAAYVPSIAHGIIMRQTLSKVRSHLLFHAAALSNHNRGIIIVADSGCGKTTLTLALMTRGFRFLSDEIAALSLSDGQLVPYYRCLWIRSGTINALRRFGLDYPDHESVRRTGDREAVHVSGKSLGHACRLDYVVFLTIPSDRDKGLCFVTVDRIGKKLLSDLQATAEVEEVINPLSGMHPKKTDSRFPVLKVRTELLYKVYDFCERNGVLILDAKEEDKEHCLFDSKPEIQKISKLTGAMELLRSFYGSRNSELFRKDFKRGPAQLIEPIIKLTRNTKFFRISPGKLNLMVEEIISVL